MGSVQSNPSSDGHFSFSQLEMIYFSYHHCCFIHYITAAKDVGVSVSQEGCKSGASLPIAFFTPSSRPSIGDCPLNFLNNFCHVNRKYDLFGAFYKKGGEEYPFTMISGAAPVS